MMSSALSGHSRAARCTSRGTNSVRRPQSKSTRLQHAACCGASSGGGPRPPGQPPVADSQDPPDPDDSNLDLSMLLPRLVFALLGLTALPQPAHAIESLPVDPFDTSGMKLGGPQEGVQDDISTIRRLLRDCFMDHLVLKKRVDLLEPSTDSPNSLFDKGAVTGLRKRWFFMDKFHCKGRMQSSHLLEAQGGPMSSAESDVPLNSVLQLGPRLQSCFVGELDTDAHITVRTICQGNSARLWQLQLQKVFADCLSVFVTPVGARFRDVAQSHHASQGEGLLDTTREGPALYSATHASGVAARLEGGIVSLAAALYCDRASAPSTGSGSQSQSGSMLREGLLGSAAAQVNVALTRTMSLGYLLNYGGFGDARETSQHGSDANKGDFAEPGEPGHRSTSSLFPRSAAGPVTLQPQDCRHGVTAAWDTGAGFVASGYWLRGCRESANTTGLQLSSYPLQNGTTFNAGAVTGPGMGTDESSTVMELSGRFLVGDGCYLQAGVVASQQKKLSFGLLTKLDFFW